MLIRAGDIVNLIIRERFGPNVAKIADVLQLRGKNSLLQIKNHAGLPLDRVREALMILIKYQLVSFQPSRQNENIIEYILHAQNVLLMLRYPHYLMLIKKKFGDRSKMIIEEILQKGFLSTSNIILNIAERLECNEKELCNIKDELVSLIVAKYVQKVPKVSDDKQSMPPVNLTEKELYAVPAVDVQLLIQAYIKKIERKDLRETETWTVNFDRFHQDMRDKCIVDAFTKRIDDNAGEFVRLLLQQMYIRTDPWADSSNPIPLSEIKRIATKNVTFANLVTFFDQYATIIEQDNYNIIVKAGEASGGSFQIHLKEAFTVLTWEVIEKIILQKFDSKAHRIFRLVREKGYIDPEQLQKLVMMPLKDAKKISFQLVEERFLKIREIRRPASSSGPNKSLTLFYIDLDAVVNSLHHLCLKTSYNVMSRRHHEFNTNKRLIEKKQRLELVVIVMKAQGATEEQLADCEDNYTPPERDIVAKTEKHMKKLSLAELELDSTLFILEMYLKYHRKKLITPQ